MMVRVLGAQGGELGAQRAVVDDAGNAEIRLKREDLIQEIDDIVERIVKAVGLLSQTEGQDKEREGIFTTLIYRLPSELKRPVVEAQALVDPREPRKDDRALTLAFDRKRVKAGEVRELPVGQEEQLRLREYTRRRVTV